MYNIDLAGDTPLPDNSWLLYSDTDYPGNDIGGYGIWVNSLDECKDSCRAIFNCVGILHRVADNHCSRFC